ncbi:MAG: hypothetical protein JW870_12390 [Candidatus Delongbacteria bacterium]|nr:hypothetical protein [Candidatus Delongbacteria bacterium]
MGYKLTSLLDLPFEEKVSLYIFSIGDGLWEGGLQDLVNKNFDNIAREIGHDAIIVGGLSFSFHGEVVRNYLGVYHKELKNQLPALLITDAHPNNLNDESLRLLIPLSKIKTNYVTIDRFFSDLALFVKGESNVFLTNIKDKCQNINSINDFVILQPNIIGFGVNINNIIIKLTEWWNRNKKNKRS